MTLLNAAAQAQTVPDFAAVKPAAIDDIVQAQLRSTGVPSAQIAIVAGGRVVYSKAYGNAQLAPKRAATNAMRYGIGSISKEFLATALLVLESEGKLKLDDKAGKYVANLGPAGEVTLRQLLSHTAGLRDYWPQDYVFPDMLRPISHEALLDRWARQPLDFAPGERWQYSNTGYVLAGVVLEKVTGDTVFHFLQSRIFTPLKMTSVIDNDTGRVGPADAAGYTAFGLGPLVPAPKEAPGWLFAAGELAMTAEDLARWDISVIEQSLLPPAAYKSLETETLLNDGAGTQYGLGLGVRLAAERRVLAHGGGVSGFISHNVIYPEAQAAIVAFTNTDTADAASAITQKIGDLLFVQASPADTAKRKAAEKILRDLSLGKFDRTQFTDNGNYYYSDKAIKETASALARLGPVKSFELSAVSTRGGLETRVYAVDLAKKRYDLVLRSWPDGKIEQFILFAK